MQKQRKKTQKERKKKRKRRRRRNGDQRRCSSRKEKKKKPETVVGRGATWSHAATWVSRCDLVAGATLRDLGRGAGLGLISISSSSSLSFFFSFFLRFLLLFLHFGLHFGWLTYYFWVRNRVLETRFPCRRHLEKVPRKRQITYENRALKTRFRSPKSSL